MARLEGKPVTCVNCGGGLPGALRNVGDGKYAHEDRKYCDYHIWKQKTEREGRARNELYRRQVAEREKIVIPKPKIYLPGEKEA